MIYVAALSDGWHVCTIYTNQRMFSSMLKYILVSSALAAVSTAYNLLKVCTDSNFGGNCVTFTGNLNTCYDVAEYNDAISSADIFGGIYCRLYHNAACSVQGPLITGPAYALADQGFDDKTSSFYCYLD